METQTWRRWIVGLSAVTILVASFAVLQWNVHDPRPEIQGALAVLGLGIAIISIVFALATDPNCYGGSGCSHP